eukprot:4281219-Lingulodinium_polyedra.AAC.1
MALTDMVRPPESNKAARRHVVNSPPGHHRVGKDDNKEVPSDRACLCLTTHPLGLLSEPYSQFTSTWGRVVCFCCAGISTKAGLPVWVRSVASARSMGFSLGSPRCSSCFLLFVAAPLSQRQLCLPFGQPALPATVAAACV